MLLSIAAAVSHPFSFSVSFCGCEFMWVILVVALIFELQCGTFDVLSIRYALRWDHKLMDALPRTCVVLYGILRYVKHPCAQMFIHKS